MKETPLMQQYNKIKNQYPNTILLFRVGDFYETFGDDAIKTAKILSITLTKRRNGSASEIELAGFPHHVLDNYLPKLIKKGLRIAICDQLEDSKFAKGIIQRGVTELITPGVILNDQALNIKSNNFILSIFFGKKNNFGIAILDISTGEFFITEGNEKFLWQIIYTYNPSEILISKNYKSKLDLKNYIVTLIEDWTYEYTASYEKLCLHFQVNSLKGFGIHELQNGISAGGSIFNYLIKDTNHQLLKHISSIQKIEKDNVIWMDLFTQKNLELIYSHHEHGKTLLNFLDNTKTPMGGRLLKRWIISPSTNIQIIKKRWEIVSFLIKNTYIKNSILLELEKISDLERLIGKVSIEKINPRELNTIKISLISIQNIKKIIDNNLTLSLLIKQLHDSHDLIKLLNEQLEDEVPILLNKGNIIKKGINNKLDQLRELLKNNKTFLTQLSNKLSKETGINNLKIDFHSIFGYYIEVKNTYKNKISKSWIRKQTLINSERYITEELKQYEKKILEAEYEIINIESILYKKIIYNVINNIASIQNNSKIIAELDILINFCILSINNQYNKPEICHEKIIQIIDGRHPIIETMLSVEDKYIENSINLNQQSQQILIITGPNMAGKSALLRQTALIIIMAQIGCYVPAKYLKFNIIDKIFTRVGASDNISQGESTFMVEMNETSNIINNLKGNSLVILDEIGRGTSTQDGVAIAWAIIEYLHEHKLRPLTLFATHYQELNKIIHINSMTRVKNFNISIKKINENIIFLRKLIKGESTNSFGIHIAKLAGMPNQIIERAEELLNKIIDQNNTINTYQNIIINKDYNNDKNLFNKIKKEILNININEITPIEGLNKLNYIQKLFIENNIIQ